MARQTATPAGARRVRVWDLPTRAFHWLLAGGIIAAFISAHAAGDTALRVHFLCGYAVLVLVLFRVAWGFAGPRYARFVQFVRGPVATVHYVRTLFAKQQASATPGYPGHNPLGALSVLALLAACAMQAGTGLFSKDDIVSEGPLARFVSEAVVDRMSGLHDLGETGLYVLLGMHLLAIAFYRWVKREDLVVPMLTGDKLVPQGVAAAPSEDRGGWGRAVVLLGLSLALVCFVVNLG